MSLHIHLKIHPRVLTLFLLRNLIYHLNQELTPSLHPNCHHQIIYARFNLEVIYPPHYDREVWHYQDSNVDLIRRFINGFDWDRAFVNKHIKQKVLVFNETVLNALSNLVSHKVIICERSTMVQWKN